MGLQLIYNPFGLSKLFALGKDAQLNKILQMVSSFQTIVKLVTFIYLFLNHPFAVFDYYY